MQKKKLGLVFFAANSCLLYLNICNIQKIELYLKKQKYTFITKNYTMDLIAYN